MTSQGYKHTEEARARIAEASRTRQRKPLTDEQRAKIREATQAAMQRPEVKAKLSAAGKAQEGRACPEGCTCKRHQAYARKCEPGCTCARHTMTEERRKKISAGLTGQKFSEERRETMKCKPGCTCPKHAKRSLGQFRAGTTGAFAGRRHSDKTKAKLASYTGAKVSTYKHGWSNTPTYWSWSGMLSRCRDPRNASYRRYGARGITVCERWHDFLNFLADMGPRPEGKTLDRINGDGNYEPGNCRWATKAEQSANRSDPGGWKARRAKRTAE